MLLALWEKGQQEDRQQLFEPVHQHFEERKKENEKKKKIRLGIVGSFFTCGCVGVRFPEPEPDDEQK
jgi:hypothetical protein